MIKTCIVVYDKQHKKNHCDSWDDHSDLWKSIMQMVGPN